MHTREHDYPDISLPIQRLSYSKKKAYDFRWCEQVTDLHDNYTGDGDLRERDRRLKMNYDLYNGYGEEAMAHYMKNTQIASLIDEGYSGGYSEVQHHPLLDQIAKAMVGEQQRRPLKPLAIDTSGYNVNMKKKKRLELYQSFLEEKVIAPIKQQSTIEILQQLGIQDMYSLAPEEQQELEFMIEEKVKFRTPDDIENFMRKEYRSPSERQAQQIVDYLMDELNIKFITDEAFKHFLISGFLLYKVSIRHNKPYVEIVNAIGFKNSQSKNKLFIEDSEWITYTEDIKYTDFFNNFGDVIKTKDFKKIENLFNSTSGDRAEHNPNFVGQVSAFNS